MGWTNPRTWVSSEVPTAAIMNTHIRDNLDYLYATDRVHAYQTGNQNITNTTGEKISWDAESYDTGSMHTTGGNNSRLIAPVSGFYIFTAKLTYEGNVTGRRVVAVRKNSAGSYTGGNDLGLVNIASAGSTVTVAEYVRMITLGAGDYIECFAYHSAGTTIYVQGGADDSFFQLARIGS